MLSDANLIDRWKAFAARFQLDASEPILLKNNIIQVDVDSGTVWAVFSRDGEMENALKERGMKIVTMSAMGVIQRYQITASGPLKQ